MPLKLLKTASKYLLRKLVLNIKKYHEEELNSEALDIEETLFRIEVIAAQLLLHVSYIVIIDKINAENISRNYFLLKYSNN